MLGKGCIELIISVNLDVALRGSTICIKESSLGYSQHSFADTASHSINLSAPLVQHVTSYE